VKAAQERVQAGYRGRGNLRRFTVSADARVDLLADARPVLASASAARALSWNLPAGNWPVECYLAEPVLVEVVERYDTQE
jgi:hypothetical protein